MQIRTCPTCGTLHSREAEECFKCHVQGVSFGFVGGGGYGRTAFHDRTIGEFIRHNVGEDYKTNPKVEKVQEGWN